MNNRQKAKKFKKLYEEFLKRPYPVKYITSTTLQHYKAQWAVNKFEAIDLIKTGMADEIAARKLLKELEPFVKENMYCYKDDRVDAFRYCVDLWAKGDEL